MDTHNVDIPPRPFHLAIVRDHDALTVSLTDLRSIAIVEVVSLRLELLEDIARAGLYDPTSRNEHAAADVGYNINKLLPMRVSAALQNSPPRELHLQLSTTVAGIAWELALNGTGFLGTRFSVSRHIIGDDQAESTPRWTALEDVCKVLLVSSELRSALSLTYQASLGAAIRASGRCSLTTANAAELSGERGRQWLDASDIVHCVGTLDEHGMSIVESAALARRPRLVVCEWARASGPAEIDGGAAAQTCVEASRAGMNVVIRESNASEAPSANFFASFYQHVVSGMSFARATQSARSEAARDEQRRVDDLSVIYCGDGTVAAFTRGERDAGVDSLRQVTVMSHDLVNSTQLIGRLGAEQYTELLGRYHQLCARIVRQHGGISDDPQGDDGVMCYFGVPLANEDACAQSIRAALEIVDAVRALDVNVRVGISTGRVVIRAGQPVGVAVHLAARLQSNAEPGTVVVADSTRRLTLGRFEFEPVGPAVQMKGIDDPVAVYRVARELHFSNADKADAALSLTPFIGREREVAVLEEHWRTTCGGAAQAVLLSGDAGIGKSRLVREFRSSLAARGTPTIECRCSPHHTSSAFYPVIGWLRRLLEIQDQEPPENRLAKIERSAISALGIDGAVSAIAALLSVPLQGLRPIPKRSAEKQRQLTLDVLVGWIIRTVQSGPLCLIVEDVQWLDPSSREFLDRLIARASSLPLMTILTLRTETE